jgi:sec-independent protein translocase protein TatA
MGPIGFKELLIILVIALLVFGGKKLRSLGSDLGSAVRGFKKAMGEGEEEETAKQLKHMDTGDQPEGESKTTSDAGKTNAR